MIIWIFLLESNSWMSAIECFADIDRVQKLPYFKRLHLYFILYIWIVLSKFVHIPSFTEVMHYARMFSSNQFSATVLDEPNILFFLQSLNLLCILTVWILWFLLFRCVFHHLNISWTEGIYWKEYYIEWFLHLHSYELGATEGQEGFNNKLLGLIGPKKKWLKACSIVSE